MFGIHDFGVFVGACIVLTLTPGPDTLYILGRSIAQGRKAGLASLLGIACGAMVHTFAAAFGLSAVLAASASAFLIVKFAGAAYLIYLGLRMLFSRSSQTAIPESFSSKGFHAVFRQGFLTNLLNPKVALFYLAFVPQFITAGSPSKFAAFVVLGFSFIAVGTVWCLTLVRFAALIGDRLSTNPTVSERMNRAAGALFVGLGVRLATSK